MAPVDFLTDGPEGATVRMLLAHGAGQAMDSDFMNDIAGGLAERGVRVLRFEFPYMAQRRQTGAKRPPDRQPVLLDAWREAARGAGEPASLVIGGKSMGGRMASMLADALGVQGLICLGYPFHPPGRPDKLRIDHLQALRTPSLILQGERDAFGKPDEVAGYPLSDAITVDWIADGDHSFKPRKASGWDLAGNIDAAVAKMAGFAETLASR